MELDQAIHERRAVREYTPQSVDEAILRRLIEAATLAPSAVNEQPWLFTVIRDRRCLLGYRRLARRQRLQRIALGSPRITFRRCAKILPLISSTTHRC